MKRGIRNFWKLIKRAGKQWNDKDPWRESAIIAYYAIFSLPGLLLVIITLAGYFFSEGRVSGYINEQIAENIGENTALQVQEVVDRAYDADQSLFMTLVGIATIIFAATGVFFQLQKSLNFIWDVKPDPRKSGIWQLIKARLFSLGLILTIAFLMLISLILTTLISALAEYIQSYLPEYMMSLFHVINFLISFAIITFLFALMFKYLPDAHIRWRTVWIGAVLTSVLFGIGKTALGIYFGQANPDSGYGAAGFVILILLWTSYSSMIVFYGAEFTRAYSDFKYGGKVEPAKHASKDENAEMIKKLIETRSQDEKRMRAKTRVRMKGKAMTKQGQRMMAATENRHLEEGEDNDMEEEEEKE
jgi:membrane protein